LSGDTFTVRMGAGAQRPTRGDLIETIAGQVADAGGNPSPPSPQPTAVLGAGSNEVAHLAVQMLATDAEAGTSANLQSQAIGFDGRAIQGFNPRSGIVILIPTGAAIVDSNRELPGTFVGDSLTYNGVGTQARGPRNVNGVALKTGGDVLFSQTGTPV